MNNKSGPWSACELAVVIVFSVFSRNAVRILYPLQHNKNSAIIVVMSNIDALYQGIRSCYPFFLCVADRIVIAQDLLPSPGLFKSLAALLEYNIRLATPPPLDNAFANNINLDDFNFEIEIDEDEEKVIKVLQDKYNSLLKKPSKDNTLEKIYKIPIKGTNKLLNY
jgi:hypothetical protein